MNFAWYALWFAVAVGLLVTVHEFGHFWVARRLGFKVLRFAVGFGRPLWKRVGAAPDHTEYVIAAIPLGGYVKMLDAREGAVDPAEAHRAFTSKPPWQRIVVLLAGPVFNIAFAILVLWAMFAALGITDVKPVVGDVRAASVAAQAGLRPGDEILAINGERVVGQRDVVFGLIDAMSDDGVARLRVLHESGAIAAAELSVADPTQRRRLTEPSQLFRGLGFGFWEPPVPAVIGRADPDGAAARAGLKAGDIILAIDGESVRDFRDVPARIAGRPGETTAITYRRSGSEGTVRLTIGSVTEDGKRIGRIGISVPTGASLPQSMLRHTDLSVPAAGVAAVREAWSKTRLQARLFFRMLTGQVSIKNLSGPISIAEFAGDSAHAGAAPFLEFLVLISLSLGFLNLLPIPILDGGQIVIQAIEWLKGRPLSERTQALGQQLGIALLLLLMGVAIYNDLARQLG
jgi:regulator of sigma E protease